jgi:DNA-binding winged helix-turn-helix (wHTH) protein/Flp pilus assembly protein TadD
MTPVPEKPILAFAGFFLDVRQRSLLGPDGASIDISARAFDMLSYLVAHPHELIDKHRLMAAVWPNRIVEENNLSQQISSLRKLLGEVPGEHRFIVTVTGQGYRFVHDVVQLESLPVVDAVRGAAAAAPRTDGGGDTHGGNASRASARWPVSAAAVSTGAAVIMLVVGAATALLSWREPRPVIDMQPQSTAALPVTGGSRNVEAYDAYLAARAVTNSGGTALAREAIPLLERAVQVDPDFALAWAALAESYTYAADFPPPSALPLTPVEIQQRISRAVLRAFELAPDAPQTLRSAGMVSMQNRDWQEAERRLRRAVEISGPHDYDANLLYALFLMNVGRTTDAGAHIERAMRAEPLLLRPVTFMAALHEMRGELDEAEALLLASSHLAGDETMRRNALVMVHLGRRDATALKRVMTEYGLPHESFDDPPRALRELRRDFADAVRDGATARLLPLASFASFHGDQTLAVQMLRALGPTQNLHALWRPALGEVRRQPAFEEVVEQLGLVDYWRLSGNWGEFCRGSPSGGFACQ